MKSNVIRVYRWNNNTKNNIMTFEKALEKVLKHEGGYSFDKVDMGGETNYGVTKKTAESFGYTGSMKDIPMSTVAKIYKEGYWDKGKCEQLPESIRYIHFDSCVNNGVGNANKFLQRSIGVADDGIVGSGTLAAASKATLKEYARQRTHFYIAIVKNKPEQIKFLKGWLNRIIDVAI
jgi:lysozyme family protein